MSIKRLTDVWSGSPYSGTALLVHLALADFADEDGVCFPRKSTLAAKARCTEETVRTTLLRMVDDGEIVVLEEPEKGRYARAGRFQLTPKKSGHCESIPKSAESIPKSADSSPPIGTVSEPSSLSPDVASDTDGERTPGQLAHEVGSGLYDKVKADTGKVPVGWKMPQMVKLLIPFFEAGWSVPEVKRALWTCHTSGYPITRPTIERELDGRARSGPRGSKSNPFLEMMKEQQP